MSKRDRCGSIATLEKCFGFAPTSQHRAAKYVGNLNMGPDKQETAPGVNAALGGICNRGLISQGGSVLVVDSGIAVVEAAPLRAAAQERQKDGALYLFNTHPHSDHVYGNQIFADGPIIAHEGVRNFLVAHGEQALAGWRQNPHTAALVSDVVITPPTLTFQDQMTLFIGDI